MSKYKNKFSYGLVITNTFFTQDSFKYIPEKFVHSEYDEKVLTNFMNIQAELVKNRTPKEAFLILDDAIDGDQWKSQTFKRLSVQLRHYHITCIISTQHVNALPPRIRGNAMYVAIFNTNTENNTRAIYQSYAQMFENYNEFKNYIFDNTGNYKFLWVDTQSTETDKTKKYKIMKCPASIKNFKVEYKTNI